MKQKRVKLDEAENNRSKSFITARAQHLRETAEDYTEMIADLVAKFGEARICEIARHMKISHVTAIKSIRRLQRDGYLETSPYQPILLTPKGKHLANFSKKRHLLLIDFLKKIGVPEEVAMIDAEGLEHHISPKTLEAIQKFLNCDD